MMHDSNGIFWAPSWAELAQFMRELRDVWADHRRKRREARIECAELERIFRL